MSQDTFQEDLNSTGGQEGFPGGAIRPGLRDEQELAGEGKGNVLVLDIIICAKAQRPERAGIVEDQKQASRLQQAGVGSGQ